MELVDGLQKHQRLQKLLEKVERRINEGDPDDAAVNMRKILEYITTQYMKEYAQRLAKEDLFGTIKGLESAGILSRETVSLFHKIRMAGNDSGAHFKEEEGSLKKTQSLYKQLLAYIPSFLEDFPEPSKKKVTDNPFNIDYMSITPLLIDVPDYKKKLGYDELFPANPPENWYPEDELRDSIDSLSWLLDEDRYIYRNNGKLYINRFQLVIDTVSRIQRFLEMGYDDSRWPEPNYIHVPAIVQEYFKFSYVIYNSVEETIQGPNGMVAKTGNYKMKDSYSDIESYRIIDELISFSKKLIIPDCITKIDDVFQICDYITEVHIPATMSANQSFNWLSGFTRSHIYVEKDADIISENNIIYTADKKKILHVPRKYAVDFKVPDEVEIIGEGAFWYSEIQSVSLNNVKTICKNAFYHCEKLKTVTNISQVESIGMEAFAYCKEFDCTVFSDKNIRNGRNAFKGCSVPKTSSPPQNVSKPLVKRPMPKIETIEDYKISEGCYALKKLFHTDKGVTIDPTEIKKFANLTHYPHTTRVGELCIPEGVTYIDANENGRSYFGQVFGLKKINLPSTLVEIGEKAFYDLKIEEIYIPDGVKTIGEYAFYHNNKVKKVRIPATVEEISEDAFFRLDVLEEIEMPKRFWKKLELTQFQSIKYTQPKFSIKQSLKQLFK